MAFEVDEEQVLMLTVKHVSVSSLTASAFVSFGSFHDFTLGFRDNFDSLEENWLLDKIEESFIQPQKVKSFGFFSPQPQTQPVYIMNMFWVPEGSIETVSRTNAAPGGVAAAVGAGATGGSPVVWELSVNCRMSGLHVRFDSMLGLWLVMMKQTVSKVSEDLAVYSDMQEEQPDVHHLVI